MGVALLLSLHNLFVLFSNFYIKCDVETINHKMKVKVCNYYKFLANF